MSRLINFIIVLCLFFPVISGKTQVNLKNGNFHISYTDLALSDNNKGSLDNITRTYNSKAIGKGIFGNGWGTPLETYVRVLPDYSIFVQNNGTGGRRYIETEFMTVEATDELIEEIAQMAVKEHRIENSPVEVTNFKNRLKNNIDLRSSYWERYVNKGWVEFLSDPIPPNLRWISCTCDNSFLETTNEGFKLVTNEKVWNYFNWSGTILKIEVLGREATLFEVEGDKVVSVINPDTDTVFIKYNEEGFISEMNYAERQAKYKYEKGNLIESTDMSGNWYVYTYDGSYNMTGIKYADSTQRKITYEPKTLFASKIEYEDGRQNLYNYPAFYKDDGSEDPDHYATEVKKVSKDLDTTYSSYNEYFIKTGPSGARYTSKLIEEINGDRATIEFDPVCRHIISIINGNGEEIIFKYNSNCLPKTEKNPHNGEIRYEYNSDNLLISRKFTDSEEQFFYDTDNHELYEAKTREGIIIRLEYNENRKIGKIIYGDKMTYELIYGSGGALDSLICNGYPVIFKNNKLIENNNEKSQALRDEFIKNVEFLGNTLALIPLIEKRKWIHNR